MRQLTKTSKLTKEQVAQSIAQYNWQYCCQIDYRTSYSCESSGCDDYCRCGQIHSTKVVSAPDVSSFVRYCLGQLEMWENYSSMNKEWNTFFLDRLYSIRKMWDTSNYEVFVVGGYYGDEIHKVKSVNGDILNDIRFLLDSYKSPKMLLDHNSLCEYLLKAEYGYVHPRLEHRQYYIKTIPFTDIRIPNDSYYKKIVCSWEIHPDAPVALVLFEDNEYKLMDGYHRYMGCQNKKPKNVSVLVAE